MLCVSMFSGVVKEALSTRALSQAMLDERRGIVTTTQRLSCDHIKRLKRAFFGISYRHYVFNLINLNHVIIIRWPGIVGLGRRNRLAR